MINVRMTLTPDEQDHITVLGKQIFSAKEGKKDKLSDFVDIVDVGGKYVVAKYLGIEIQDNNVFYKEQSIEVKTGKPTDTLFKIPKSQIDKDVDIYVMVKRMYKLQTWQIVGWVTKNEFMTAKKIKTFKGYEHAPMWVMPMYCLTSPTLLKQ